MKRLLATALVILALAACAPPIDDDPCDHEAQDHAQGMIECPDIDMHGHLQEISPEVEEHGDEHEEDGHDD